MANSLIYDADKNGRIIRWHWIEDGRDALRIQCRLINKIATEAPTGRKLKHGLGHRYGIAEELRKLGLAEDGDSFGFPVKQEFRLTDRGVAVRDFFNGIAPLEELSPFATAAAPRNDPVPF